MQNVLETQSVSWAQSVKIALQSEGLHAVVLDEYGFGSHGLLSRVRVAVPDGEVARARAVIIKITPRFTGLLPSWRIQKRGLLLVGSGIVLGSYSTARFGDPGPGPLTYALAGIAIVVVVAGFVLIALGLRQGTDPGPNTPRGAA